MSSLLLNLYAGVTLIHRAGVLINNYNSKYNLLHFIDSLIRVNTRKGHVGRMDYKCGIFSLECGVQ